MIDKVVTTSMDARPVEVATTMRNNRYSCMVVTDNNIPVGIVTERDIVRAFINLSEEKTGADLSMQQLVTKEVISVDEDTSLFDAMVLIESRKIRHLPVVDKNGNLTGLVTYSDLVRNHQRTMNQHIQIVEKEVKERTRQLTEANDKLHALSLEDHLLKIGNRRAMEVDLKFTHDTALRYKRTYSIALIDVDYFKKYNDRYGHKAGDIVLQKVINSLKEKIRKSDRLYRYGGEEFLLLMQETSQKGAFTLMQRLLTGVEELNIRHEHSPLGRVTVSTGIASLNHEDTPIENWSDLVGLSDAALYQAKENGRNLCVVSDQGSYKGQNNPAVSKTAA